MIKQNVTDLPNIWFVGDFGQCEDSVFDWEDKQKVEDAIFNCNFDNALHLQIGFTIRNQKKGQQFLRDNGFETWCFHNEYYERDIFTHIKFPAEPVFEFPIEKGNISRATNWPTTNAPYCCKAQWLMPQFILLSMSLPNNIGRSRKVNDFSDKTGLRFVNPYGSLIPFVFGGGHNNFAAYPKLYLSLITKGLWKHMLGENKKFPWEDRVSLLMQRLAPETQDFKVFLDNGEFIFFLTNEFTHNSVANKISR